MRRQEIVDDKGKGKTERKTETYRQKDRQTETNKTIRERKEKKRDSESKRETALCYLPTYLFSFFFTSPIRRHQLSCCSSQSSLVPLHRMDSGAAWSRAHLWIPSLWHDFGGVVLVEVSLYARGVSRRREQTKAYRKQTHTKKMNDKRRR